MGARETVVDIIDRAYFERWGVPIRDRVWLSDLAEDIVRALQREGAGHAERHVDGEYHG